MFRNYQQIIIGVLSTDYMIQSSKPATGFLFSIDWLLLYVKLIQNRKL